MMVDTLAKYKVEDNYPSDSAANYEVAAALNNIANEFARYNNILVAKYSQDSKEEFYDMYLSLQEEKP
jgi:hypothetical protein